MTQTLASGVDSVEEYCLVMATYVYGEGEKEDPWQGSIPECSTLELPLQGASFDVLSVHVYEVGAISMPINSCGNTSGFSIGVSVSSYSSTFVLSKIVISSRSSAMIDMPRIVMLNMKKNNSLLYIIVC